MTKRKYVDVTVSWCYGECCPTAKVTLAEWDAIRGGQEHAAVTSYWYEGKEFTALFAFNHNGKGSLRVSYDDGGEGFIGDIWEADIVGGEYPMPDEES